jgi:class 3 adenylate cyclase
MTTEEFQRKLTAILSADVVGYSRLMGEDEEATVRILNRYKEMIFGLIERQNGRLVDSPGDNLLAEFVNVVDAVGYFKKAHELLDEIRRNDPLHSGTCAHYLLNLAFLGNTQQVEDEYEQKI